ncbi:MAG: phenylacetyl-CoA:acceptor oxidoreductase [Betaproteobacteria bacterium]|nr:MAG: phenylacetyl-CoA:acceptor oxidoreductase [Betaproteobacteria bacterium]
MTSLQRYWDARAALNFILGGSGAGLIIAAAFIHPASPWPVAAGLAFIATGLFAVWLETGRKLRALHVLFNPFTSWMTREAFAALVLFPVGLGAFLTLKFLPVAAVLALVFLWCQARILRASRGIPAWRVAQVVPLIIAAGFAEGASLAVVLVQTPLAAALLAIALIARLIAWSAYRGEVKSEALEGAGRALQLGAIAALVLIGAGFYFTQAALPAAVLAGVVTLASGWWLKFTLVTRAAFTQGFSLPRQPVRGTR